MFKKSEGELFHHIIGAALYMHDHKHGNYVVLSGVTDRGYILICAHLPNGVLVIHLGRIFFLILPPFEVMVWEHSYFP